MIHARVRIGHGHGAPRFGAVGSGHEPRGVSEAS